MSGRRPRVEPNDGLASFRGYVPRPPLDADVALIWFVDGVQTAARKRILRVVAYSLMGAIIGAWPS